MRELVREHKCMVGESGQHNKSASASVNLVASLTKPRPSSLGRLGYCDAQIAPLDGQEASSYGS